MAMNSAEALKKIAKANAACDAIKAKIIQLCGSSSHDEILTMCIRIDEVLAKSQQISRVLRLRVQSDHKVEEMLKPSRAKKDEESESEESESEEDESSESLEDVERRWRGFKLFGKTPTQMAQYRAEKAAAEARAKPAVLG